MPVIKKTEYQTLDTGVYAATITAIEEKLGGQYGPQFVWKFELEDGSDGPWGYTGQAMSPKAKFTQWVRAVMGEVPDSIDTDDLIGKACRLSVVIKVGEDGNEYNRVDAILAPRKGQEPAKRRPKPEMVADEQEIPF